MSNDTMPCGCEGHADNEGLCRYPALEAKLARAREALEGVAGSVCARLCPTTWKTVDGQRHHESCEKVRAALADLEGT